MTLPLPGLRDHRVPVGSLDLSVREWGVADGRPIVLLHGFSSSSAGTWEPLGDRLASLGRVLAIDLRGHGASDWDPDLRYRLGTYVDDVERVIEALDLWHVTVVGHSLGGRIALHVASRSDRVDGVVIVDTRIRPGRREGTAFVERPRRFADRAAAESYATARLGSRHRIVTVELVDNPDGTVGWRFDAEGLLTAREQPDELIDRGQWPELEGLHMPVLLVKAGRSRTVPPDDLPRIEALAPRVELIVYSEAHHALQLEEPDRFVRDLQRYLAKVPCGGEP